MSAIASLSLSMLRISVCAEPVSSLIRSSKVNISALMRSAASRFSSSSAVRKRVSVWRSKLLKISAITSCASRRRVCDRLDMNSVRSVCSTRSITSFCTASICSMRLTTSSERSSGRIASTRAACSGAQLGQHHRHGLRVFVLEIVRQHLFLHVGELLPHVAAGGAADFVHDAVHALGRQVLLQQALGGVVVAEQRARGRHARRRIRAAASRPRSASTVPSEDITIEISRSSSSSSMLKILPPYCSPSASISTAARSGPVSLRRPVRDLRAAGELGHQAADVLADCASLLSLLGRRRTAWIRRRPRGASCG